MIILKANPPQKDSIEKFDDLRKVHSVKEKRFGSYYHIHLVPKLPEFTDKVYRYADVEMNLYNLTCTCDTFNDKILLGYAERDIRRLCIHLYYKLINSAAKKNVDQLTRLLMESAVKHNAQHFYKYFFRKENREVYYSFSEHTEWINVFMQVRKEDDAEFVRLGYNPSLHRWNYGRVPELASQIEHIADTIIKNQLPYKFSAQNK